MLKIKKKKVLVLSPHTDDGELGCGGTISSLIEDGNDVFCAAFSTAEKSIPKGFSKDATKFEFLNAMDVLGVKKENLTIFNFEVRMFPQYRQEILEQIILIRNDIKPDLIFSPSLNDIHQDHQIIAQESLRAFKKSSILGYELPWNNIIFETKCFKKLEKKHLDLKVEALYCYKTQQQRSYLDEDFIYSLAKTRGTQFESNYAEAFEVQRLIL